MSSQRTHRVLQTCVIGAGFLLGLPIAAANSFTARLAADLRAGARLTYRSDSATQPPWTVDSLTLATAGIAGAECVLLHMRRQAQPSAADREHLCLAHDTLYRWNGRTERWTIARPIGPAMRWSTVQASGDSVHYETGTLSSDTVQGKAIPVVATTVTTVDSFGRPKRRLRERYAPSLVTATGGVFEVPDSAHAGVWRPGTSFTLIGLEYPAP